MPRLILRAWGEYAIQNDIDKKCPEWECPECDRRLRLGADKIVGFDPDPTPALTLLQVMSFANAGKVEKSRPIIAVECSECRCICWMHMPINPDHPSTTLLEVWPEELIDRSVD